ncbi:MAG: hypothetical protein IT303_19630 [Dehalococcoidia bacterium]|nr:hypothetical protein [Dehalococcoidia bacterium]
MERDHEPPPRAIVTLPRLLMAVAALAVALASVTAVFAQAAGWDLSWYTLSGGGGKSSGGTYDVYGSIGQSIVGQASGGVFTLDAGHLGGGQEKYKRFIPAVASDGLP